MYTIRRKAQKYVLNKNQYFTLSFHFVYIKICHHIWFYCTYIFINFLTIPKRNGFTTVYLLIEILTIDKDWFFISCNASSHHNFQSSWCFRRQNNHFWWHSLSCTLNNSTTENGTTNLNIKLKIILILVIFT